MANGASEKVTDILECQNGDSYPSVNFTKIREVYGEGLYRLIRCGKSTSDGELLYVAKEIQLIDSQKIADNVTLGELLGSDVVSAKLNNGTESIEITGALSDEFFETIMQLKCVGVQDKSWSVGPSGGCSYTAELSDGTSITIRNQSGKTLDGIEYSMVCNVSGMTEYILLGGE